MESKGEVNVCYYDTPLPPPPPPLSSLTTPTCPPLGVPVAQQ